MKNYNKCIKNITVLSTIGYTALFGLLHADNIDNKISLNRIIQKVLPVDDVNLPTNPALKRIKDLAILIADKTNDEATKLALNKELFGILSERGTAYKKYGAASNAITAITLDNFPSSNEGLLLLPKETAFLKEQVHYFPTNDWLQQLATYPESKACSSNGIYLLQFKDDRSISYSLPLGFNYENDLQTNLTKSVKTAYNNGFYLSTKTALNPHPFIKWKEHRVGNMCRHIVYNDVSYYLAQGSLLQGVYYKNAIPEIGLNKPEKTRVVFRHSKLENGVHKYRIRTNDVIYVFYARTDLNVEYNHQLGKLTSNTPYSGIVNAASFPNDSTSNAIEKALDLHADVVIVRAQGTLLLDGEYQFAYMCHDLNGSPSSKEPLVFLKNHHVKNLIDNHLNKNEKVALLSLEGALAGYSGSAFSFKAPVPKISLTAIPKLPNGFSGIVKTQALEVMSSGWLDKGLLTAFNTHPADNIIVGGKQVYQMALTLAYAQEVMEVGGETPTRIRKKLQPLYKKVTNELTSMWQKIDYIPSWGTLAPKEDDNGTRSQFTTHADQYSYLIYSLALISQFENAYINNDNHYLNQYLTIEGYQSYTNKDMGDLLASDIGETNYHSQYPAHRNFDIYNGFSYTSGIAGPNEEGNLAESQSEAAFAAFAVAAWLKITQPQSMQYYTSLTRWALETQGLNAYFQIGSKSKSIYEDVAKDFPKENVVVPRIWDIKLSTFSDYGNKWDAKLFTQITPVGANFMDNQLNNNLKYAKRVSEYILDNWSDKNIVNSIPSTFVPLVARFEPKTALRMINAIEKKGDQYFHYSTNSFILYMTALYASNEKLFD